jgi:ketosteroid isomerase-like protein
MKAQTNMELLQNEIDKTVWTQFKRAFETIDAEVLNSTYAENVLRVTPSGIDTQNVFKTSNIERFKLLKERAAIMQLDFWFESRQTNSDTSYEVGFYRIKTSMDGTCSTHYGQIHIVLKKLDGYWKIIQDWDTTHLNGKEIGQDEFERNGQNRIY